MHKFNLEKNKSDQYIQEINKHDSFWIKRKRKINTLSIFENLIESGTMNYGVSTCVKSKNNISHVAVQRARSKLKENIFKEINNKIQTLEHIYAIDGSKIRVHNSFKKKGYKSRTCDVDVPRPAKRPLAMLSALSGVYTDTIHNYTITKHFNERKCVPELIQNLKKQDIVIMDRGYYSAELFSHFHEKGIHCIMRLKKDANKVVKKFFSSSKTHLKSFITFNGKKIPIRYTKYFIDNKIYIMGTSILHLSPQKIKKMYKLRWRVEIHFKRLKSYNNINKIYATTEKLWIQEMQARILFDTICRKEQENPNYTHKRKRKISYRLISLFVIKYFKNDLILFFTKIYERSERKRKKTKKIKRINPNSQLCTSECHKILQNETA